ncbi:guanine nucleotide-binding protein subunit alpha, partial [Quaeritorhiza haematococci]
MECTFIEGMHLEPVDGRRADFENSQKTKTYSQQCTFSIPPSTRRLAKKISDQIDEQIRRDRIAQMQIRGPKILLLGSADSGKTTVLKQMKILHGNGFTSDERKDFRRKILDNIVDSIRALVNALDILQVPIGDTANEFYARQVREGFPRGTDGSLPSHIVTAIKVLWNDTGIQKCFERANEFFIQDTADYFLNEIDRFCDPSFLPNDQDILRTRFRTSEISETRFNIDNLVYRIYDVGGQRSDRLFWAPYFEGEVHAILFIVSLAAYDQLLVEDTTVNRMLDALVLFESICNNPLLKNVSMILFLNKTDLFEKKLKSSPLQKYFPDYN